MNQRFNQKLELAKYLLNKNFEKKYIYSLFQFLEWIFILPIDLDKIYYEELKQLKNEEKDMFIPPYAEDAVNALVEQGIEKGIEKGLNQGETKMLLHLLKTKFKKVPKSIIQLIEQANEKQKMRWMDKILDAHCIEELLEY